MQMRMVYEAIDGKVFSNDKECKAYETSLQGEKGKDFAFYDIDFNVVDLAKLDRFSKSDLYNTHHVCYINILTDKGVQSLKQLSVNINSVGIYEYQTAYHIRKIDDLIDECNRNIERYENIKERLGDLYGKRETTT